MTRAKRKNIRKQTRRRNYKKIGGMLQLAKRLTPYIAKSLTPAANSLTPAAKSLTSYIAKDLTHAAKSSAAKSLTPYIAKDLYIPPAVPQATIFNFNPQIPTTVAMRPVAMRPDEIPTTSSVPITAYDVLKFMKDNNITIEDLQKITKDETIVKSTEQAVEQAFANQGSVNWQEMREMQNRAYQAFNKINVFTHAWKNFVEDKCKTLLPEEQDKCFAIRGFVYILLMVSLIIFKMVDSHNKKEKISDLELVNVANTVVSGLVLDRIFPSQLQNVIAEHVNKIVSIKDKK